MSTDNGSGPDRYIADVPLVPGDPRVAALREVADHWGLVLTYGVLTLALGVILAVWPSQTIVVCAVLIAIQLLLSGAVRIGMAFFADSAERGIRLGLTGAISLIIGLLCLRDPVQTLLVISILLGAWWVVSGVVDIVGALLSPLRGRRGWDVTMGIVSVVAGGFLLIDPRLSVGVLVVVICIWLFAIGLLAVTAGLRLRALRRTSGDRSQEPLPPAPAL